MPNLRPVNISQVYPLPTAMLRNIEYVIYREIAYDKEYTTNGGLFYCRLDGRVHLSNITSVGSDISEILSNIGEYENLPVQPVGMSHYESDSLSIAVYSPSYVILSLKRCPNLVFGGVPESNNSSVSFASPTSPVYANNFSSVMHYDAATDSISNTVPDDCRLIAFAVNPLVNPTVKPGYTNRQKINFHVRDSAKIEQIIDPDIRYPGNSGLDQGDDPPFPILTPPAQPWFV